MASTSTEEEIPLLDYVSDIVSDIATKEGFTDFSIRAFDGSNPGDGFMSVILRVCITGQRRGKAGELYLIVKMPPTDAAVRNHFMMAAVFGREIYMYEKVLPLLINFQEEKGITNARKGFAGIPKLYATLSDATNDRYVIVMEDLLQRGYRMCEKYEPIEHHHVRLVITELAKLHAISFALRDQQPEVFEELKQMPEVFLDELVLNSDLTRKFVDFAFSEAIKSFDSAEDSEAIEVMTRLKDNFVNEMRDCVGPGVAEPLGVVTHGDAWSNNFFFKYEETGEGSDPKRVILIDWQLSRFASPVLDVVQFIFSSTNHKYRTDFYNDLIDCYYDNLVITIRRLGTDPRTQFRLSTIKHQLKKFGKFALLTVPMLMQVIMSDPKDMPCFESMSKNLLKEQPINLNFEELNMFITSDTKVAYMLNVSHAIKDAIKLGYV